MHQDTHLYLFYFLSITTLQAYDADGNGVISFSEFLTTMSISAKGSPEDKLNWSFDLYDHNGDGTISRKEAVDIIWVYTKLII